MTKGKIRSNNFKNKMRYGIELGNLLQNYFDNPPYIPPPYKIGFVWTPKLFSTFVGFSDSAVRQWLRGDELPMLAMPSIITQIFGPNPEQFASEIEELRTVFRRCQKIRDGVSESVADAAQVSTLIPRVTQHFVGRHEEVVRLASILIAPNNKAAILVQGGPGIGKTELTKAVAHDSHVASHFGDKRWFVPLETSITTAQMKEAINYAINGNNQISFQETLSNLHEQNSLLILDNLETPWESIEQRGETESLLTDLSEIPGLSLLTSFRGFDFIDGPMWQNHRTEALSYSASTKLFAAIAGDWVLGDDNLRRFMEALGGIPLAIDLVARRARGRRSLSSLWREWRRIGAALASCEEVADSHTTSLFCSINLSLDSYRMRKSADNIRLFSLLGSLPAGLTPEDREALMGQESFVCEQCLVECGIAVETINSSAGMATEYVSRITLLAPIRDHAARYHPPSEEDAKSLMVYYARLINFLSESIDFDTPLDGLARLRIEFDNIDKAFNLKNRTETFEEFFGQITERGKIGFMIACCMK